MANLFCIHVPDNHGGRDALRIPACLTNIRIFVEYDYFNIAF